MAECANASCRRGFVPGGNRAKFCSSSCRRAARNQHGETNALSAVKLPMSLVHEVREAAEAEGVSFDEFVIWALRDAV